MKQRFYFWLLWSLLPIWAQAQIELVYPIENSVLQRHAAERQQAQAEKWQKRLLVPQKNTCGNLEVPGIYYVNAGQTLALKINADTVGRGAVNFTCIACNLKSFGDATITGDSLIYTANNQGSFGDDIVEVEYCSQANPSNCGTIKYQFRVRRAGTTVFPTRIDVQATKSTLPIPFGAAFFGKSSCNPVLLNCPNSYQGRNQERVFLLRGDNSYQIVYQAGRVPGIDTVCVVLCDSVAAFCDTFRFSFQILSNTLDIPFMDDFSYFGPYPKASHWQDLNVFVNNDLADTPPSWGVATFDGLDSGGTAYGGGYGYADTLTSQPINLGGVRENTYLSYWIQRRGLGDGPEGQDSFLVEFKRPDNSWVVVDSLPGGTLGGNSTTAFRFRSILIADSIKHNGFQFRFRNKSDRTGILDLWHLDYVRLDRNTPDSIFSDIAFTRFPNFILKNYSSMPWRQFQGYEEKELYDSIKVHLRNHFSESQSVFESKVKLFEINTNQLIFDQTLFVGTQGNIPNTGPIFREYALKGDATGFGNVWQTYLNTMRNSGFQNYKRLDFRLEYLFTNTSQNFSQGYKESVEQNDSVRRFTTFANYFAYDDGTAESGLIVQQNSQVAVKFTVNEADTLRAVQFHFPRTTIDISSQRFTIRIWRDTLDDTPEYEAPMQRAFYTDLVADTLQGFTTYPLQDAAGKLTPLVLSAGSKFYVGWRQDTRCEFTQCIPVGYDRNTPDSTKSIFQRSVSGRVWLPLPPGFQSGVLMIRPVVGSETPPATTATDDLSKPVRNFVLYPNPTRDLLNITPNQGWYEDFQYQLFNSTGQRMQAGTLPPQLSVGDLPPGVYFLKIADRKSNQMWNEKFIIAR